MTWLTMNWGNDSSRRKLLPASERESERDQHLLPLRGPARPRRKRETESDEEEEEEEKVSHEDESTEPEMITSVGVRLASP